MKSGTTTRDSVGHSSIGSLLKVRYGLVTAVAMVAMLVPWSTAQCGAVFDRVMKSGNVRLGVPYNRIPQGFLKPSGEWSGFELDLAKEMAKHMNLKLEMVKVNEQTWGPMLSRGRIDAALCRITHRRSLENAFDFSVPYFFDALNILVLKGTFKSTGDLKGNKIAAVQGSPSEKVAMRLLKEAGDQAAEKNVSLFPRPTHMLYGTGTRQSSGMVGFRHDAHKSTLPAAPAVSSLSRLRMPLKRSLQPFLRMIPRGGIWSTSLFRTWQQTALSRKYTTNGSDRKLRTHSQ